MRAPTCPRCAKRMEEGFVVDEGYGKRTPARWVEGAPQRSFWTGLSIRGRRQLTIASWRCTGCGLLENYATA